MQRQQVNFTLIDETADLLVVEKPAGVLVHPSKPGGPVTLWDEVCKLLAYEIVNGGQGSIINRLDRETSGLTLIAKSASAARTCAIAMQEGRIRKRYSAIVTGWPEWESTMVNQPIVRLGEVSPSAIWLKRAVHPAGAPSITEFQVQKRWEHPIAGKLALIQAVPRTGRTHQIRVHLSHLGFPVVGDKIYGPDEAWYLRFVKGGWTDAMQNALHLNRHALHSELLAIDYDGVPHCWEIPLPPDMMSLLPELSR